MSIIVTTALHNDNVVLHIGTAHARCISLLGRRLVRGYRSFVHGLRGGSRLSLAAVGEFVRGRHI